MTDNDRIEDQKAIRSALTSFAERVRAKIDALKQRGPKAGDLGSGMADRAAREMSGRKRRIDQAIDEATQ
jgi:hypothetical protein